MDAVYKELIIPKNFQRCDHMDRCKMRVKGLCDCMASDVLLEQIKKLRPSLVKLLKKEAVSPECVSRG